MKKQNINIGDMLLCKKTYCHCTEELTKGHRYKVIEIINDSEDYYYLISNNECKFVVSGTEIVLYDNFYTKNEVIKMKLKKLYD